MYSRLFGASLISVVYIALVFLGSTSCKSSQKIARTANSGTNDKGFYKNYESRLGISLNGNENKKLLTAISDWLGTPYKYGGCDKSGTDCSCFVRSVIKEVYNIELQRRSQDMILDVAKVKKDQLSDGDLVFFKIRGNQISHVGIYINGNKFVHASKKRGVIINDLNETYYRQHFYAGGKLKGNG